MKRLICLLRGHIFYSVMWCSERCEKVRCRRCDRAYAINHEMRAVLPWDDETERFYKRFGTYG
jgi:hypothetical protein